MKRIFIFLFLLPTIAFCADLTDAVRDVAGSKMSITTTIYGQNTTIVYVGASGTCESVSIMWTRLRIENYRVCNGEVRPRNTVSPAWDNSASHGVFSSVVTNAISYGQAKQKDSNGYLISARSLNAVSSDCKNIEVIVSYDGDLVDRDVHQICEK